jgi:hypothetical protein
MVGKITWFEIAAKDLERAKKFYADVFDLEFTFVDMPDSPMYMINVDQEKGEVGGAIVKSEMNTPSHDGTIIYLHSDDADIELAKVESAGGKILIPKMSLGEFGFMGQIEDTEGNRIGIYSVA